MSDESPLKSKFVEGLAKWGGLTWFRHEDVRTSGIPDLSLTANSHTTWVEFKHWPIPPRLSPMPDIQELTMLRLEGRAFLAVYILWLGEGDKAFTAIVVPSKLRPFVLTGPPTPEIFMSASLVFNGHEPQQAIRWLYERMTAR